MTRLDEIKAKYDLPIPGFPLMSNDFAWLIRRVEKLEAALKFYSVESEQIDFCDLTECEFFDDSWHRFGTRAAKALAEEDEK